MLLYLTFLLVWTIPCYYGYVRINPFRRTISISTHEKVQPLYIIEDVLPFQQNNMSQIEDDGYSRDNVMTGVISRLRKIASRVIDGKKQPGVLILVRHGESTWNNNKTFTG